MPDRELSFEIKSHLADRRGNVNFEAVVDGRAVDIGRYRPGDVTERRKIAEQWSRNAVLNKGRPMAVQEVADALAEVEAAARADIEAALDDDAESQGGRVTEAASYVDQDRLVELAWNTATGGPDFIVYDRHSHAVERHDSVDVGGIALIPPICCHGVVTPGGHIPGTVLVSTEYDEQGLDEGMLREAVRGFVDRYVELPGDAADIAVEYIFLSWVHDGFDEVPYMAFRTADCGRGKSRALETVGALCYRPILCGGGSTAAATLRLLDTFGGTLVADEYDQRDTELASELTRIINQGFQTHRPLVRCDGEQNQPKAFRCFGPKLFALRKGFADDATESRIISIRMRQRTRSDIPISLPRAEFDAKALRLRNRLLAYRFARLGHIQIDPDHVDHRLEDRLNQIGLPLMAVAGTAAGRARIVAALREQQNNLASERSDSLSGEVLNVILDTVSLGGVIRPGDLAKDINRHRASDLGVEPDRLPKDHCLTPQKAGWICKSVLELPRERDMRGTFYLLQPERTEQLRSRFGLPLRRLPSLPDCHAGPTLPAENPLFDAENANSGNHGNHGNVWDAPRDGNGDCQSGPSAEVGIEVPNVDEDMPSGRAQEALAAACLINTTPGCPAGGWEGTEL